MADRSSKANPPQDFPGAPSFSAASPAPKRGARLAGLCGLWGAWALALAPLASARAATDPRIVERYRQMLAANPAEGTALDRLWKIAEEEGTTGRLLDEYAELAAKGDFTGQMIYGLLLARAGRGAESLESFRKAAATDPKSPLPLLALARGLSLPAEKAAELEKAAALLPPGAPRLPDLLQQLGDAWMAADEPGKAAEAWEKIVSSAPGNLALRQRLAGIYAGKKMTENAAVHYAYLEEHGDAATRVEAYRAHARLHQANNDPGAALDALEKAMALTAADHWVRGELVSEMIRISQQTGRVAELEARWKKAAEANPRQAAPWTQLAALYEREADLQGQRGALEKLAALAPGDLKVKTELARLLVRLDRLQEAAAQFDAVLELQSARPGKPGRDADLVFERAELDIRLGRPEAARQRIAALEPVQSPSPGEEGDATIAARALAFYQRHRMFEAAEELLRKPGGDPAALAEFLFGQNRPKEARAVLEKLARPGDPPAVRAQAHQRASDLLKQAGETGAAIAELRAAAALAGDSRTLQLALGDLLIASVETGDAGDGQAETAARRKAARDAYSRALALSRTDPERVEADQRLFRSFEGNTEDAGETPTLLTAASRAAAAILSVPVPEISPAPRENAALRQFIESLTAAARDPAAPAPARAAAWLRLARWQFWNRDLEAAQTAVNEAVTLEPNEAAARELAVSIAIAAGDRNAAIAQLQRLTEAAPDRKAAWLKQIAQIRLQMGQVDEALGIFEELARGGDPGALSDLANSQQQAERWYDALNTWERLYGSAQQARRYETLQAMVRAMQRLGMKQRILELLWNGFEEQADETVRAAILHDLIAQARAQGSLPWLLEKLRARAAASPEAADTLALAQALKADGRMEEAYSRLQEAAVAAKDRSAAEEELVREAEALRDYPQAARHQQLRLKFLPSPTAADWEKLAVLQEAALDYAASDETRAGIARRFPRDSEALLQSARYFEKWGQPERAREIVRAVHAFDPGNVEAAAALVRLTAERLAGDSRDGNRENSRHGQGAEDRKTIEAAAEAVLAHSAVPSERDSLVLPPVPAPVGNRLRAYFSTLGGPRPAVAAGAGSAKAGGGVSVDEERSGGALGATAREWRLEAIRSLAEHSDFGRDEAGRQRWIERWRTASPSEKLWAYHYAGANGEALAHLLALTVQEPENLARRCALIWSALRLGDWKRLDGWLWKPERRAEDHEAFRVILREWCLLNAPLDPEALFANAPLSQVWPCAEVLAAQHRLAEAVTLGRRVFEAMPAPRGATGLTLARWMIFAGRSNEAKAVLREVAAEPADSLEDPTYAAQRALFLMLPELERDRWVKETLASVEGAKNGPGVAHASPIHATLTAALLHLLSGDTAAAHAALERLVALRAGSFGEAPVSDRVWSFLLATGVQLQLWDQDEAAAYLWEKALADRASIRLEGDRAIAFADEMRMRLAAIRLTRADERETERQLEELIGQTPPAGVNQLASILETSGFRSAAARTLDAMQRREPGAPVLRLLAACKAVGETALGDAAVERWMLDPKEDMASAPAVLDWIAAKDPARALEVAADLAAKSPGDQRLLEFLARLQSGSGRWKEAEESYRRLAALQPGNPLFQIGLAEALSSSGRREEAVAILKTAPRRGPELDAKMAELFIASGEEVKARLLASDLSRGENPAFLVRVAKAFAKAGQNGEGLALLASAVDASAEAGKPRAAYSLQRELLLLAGPDSPLKARWLGRLRELADRPEFVSSYFELTSDSRWQPPADRLNELLENWDQGRGSAVAGAWLVAALLEGGRKEAAADVLETLLPKGDLQQSMLLWLDDRCKAANRPDLSLKITGTLLARLPDETGVVLRRARSLHALGRDEEASALLDNARARLLFTPEWTGRMALAAFEVGDSALASRLFARAIAADPAARQSEAYLGYVRLLLEDRDFPGAKRVLRQAFRNPQNRNAAAIVHYLKTSGRAGPGRFPAELRDLELRPEVAEEVGRLLGGQAAAGQTGR